MTSRWIELRNGQYPRKGEIILVRGSKGSDGLDIYPHLLYAEGQLDWWVYDSNFKKFFDANNGVCSGTKLSFHGITHWMLVESPY